MPVVFIEAPPGIRLAAKQTLMKSITAAVEAVYPIGETLVFLREYPLEDVALNGRLQSENPMVLEAVQKTRNL